MGKLDTSAKVNLMPMAVYCLMFKDPQLKKLTPSNMEIGDLHIRDSEDYRYVSLLLSTPREQTLAESHIFYC